MYQSIVLFIIAEILLTSGSWPHVLTLLISNAILYIRIRSESREVPAPAMKREVLPAVAERNIQNQILSISKVIQTESGLVDRLMSVVEGNTHVNLIHISTILNRLCKTAPHLVTAHPIWTSLVSLAISLIAKETVNLKTGTSVIVYLVRTFGVNGNKALLDSINVFCVRNLENFESGMIVQIVTTVKDLPCLKLMMDRYAKMVVPDSSNRDLQYLISKRIPLKPELLLKFTYFRVNQAASLIGRKNMPKAVIDHILCHLETMADNKHDSSMSLLESIWTPKSDDESPIDQRFVDDLVFYS
jgi:hypothetical protein